MTMDEVKNWVEGEWTSDNESLEWIKSRPEAVKKMMLAFPPSCVVKANINLHCPKPDEFAIVTSFYEPSSEHPNGLITVRDGGEGEIRHQCEPEWLEVVAYWRGWTPEKMQEVLK